MARARQDSHSSGPRRIVHSIARASMPQSRKDMTYIVYRRSGASHHGSPDRLEPDCRLTVRRTVSPRLPPYAIPPPMKLLSLALFFTLFAFAQDEQPAPGGRGGSAEPINAQTFAGLRVRSIGPAFVSGRVSQIAVFPDSASHYLVAEASGGVWLTTNSGASWTPVFDTYGSYSIGTVTIDQKNPSIVWLGTGENNSQRSVSYGDGVYKSEDGGRTWRNVGLKKTEHIARIVLDPKDSNVVYVAAPGPLWKGGVERGLYKTNDGGKTWSQSLVKGGEYTDRKSTRP